MNPLERLLHIEARLDSGAISVDEACAELFTGQKPWHTAWWKANRGRLLGTECATCGSVETPLVLQHTWQPIGWRDALRAVGPPNWEWWKQQHPLPHLAKPEQPLVERPVCPECGSIRVRPRKRTADWTCQAGQCGAPHERHEKWAFPVPNYELRPDTKAISHLNRAVRGRYATMIESRWQEWLQSESSMENRRNALRLYIAESKRYLSFSDTKTLCKRCAGREDFRHIDKSEEKARQARQKQEFAEFDELE